MNSVQRTQASLNGLVAPELLIPNKQEEDSSNFLKDLLIIVATESVKNAIVASVSATITPVAGLIMSLALDIGVSILQDYLTGNDPFTLENLIFSVGFPAVRSLRKYNTLKAYDKSFIRTLSAATNNPKYQQFLNQLHDDLHNMKIVDGSDDLRNYQKILDKYDPEIMQMIFVDTGNFQKLLNKEKYIKAQFNNYSKKLSLFNKTISMLDPYYAARTLGAKLTKNWKKSINRYISTYVKKWFPKLSKSQKYMYKTLIPLKHEGKNWILGIRISPGVLPHLFNVRVVFNPKLTRSSKTPNGKQPVFLYNRTINEINEFINASSAGRYYIQNIAWGWEIGLMIRNNFDTSQRAMFLVTSNLNYLSRSFSLVMSTYRSLKKAVDNVVNFDKKINDINLSLITNSFASGTLQGIKYTNTLRGVYNSFITGDKSYFARYTKNKVLKTSRNIYTRKLKKLYGNN